MVDKFGRTMLSEEVEGLLLYNGGTVCGFVSFYDGAANAICKEMGFDDARSWRTGIDMSYSEQTKYPISLAQVVCSEPHWSSCFYSTSPGWQCDRHFKDVFLVCSRSCPPGMYRNSKSCIQCPSNTYIFGKGMKECTTCPGFSVSDPGSTFCNCEAGYFWDNESCLLCPKTYVSKKGALQCTRCPSGSIALNFGSSCSCPAGMEWIWDGKASGSCNPCLQGTYKTEKMLKCSSCPEGTTSSAGSDYCLCNSGMFWYEQSCYKCRGNSASQEGAMQCTECPSSAVLDKRSCSCPVGNIWTWCSVNQTNGSCTLCLADTYKNSQTSACLPCPPHSTSTVGSESCSCRSGTYKNQKYGSCTICPAGTSPNKKAEHCICSAGTFWNGTACQDCSAGSVSQKGALQCVPCESGYQSMRGGKMCGCPDGSVWSWEWDEFGAGACTAPLPQSGSGSTVVILACVCGLMVAVSFTLGLILCFRKRRIIPKDPEIVARGSNHGASYQVYDQKPGQGLENNCVASSENIYETVDFTARS